MRTPPAGHLMINMSTFSTKQRLECPLVSQPNFALPANGQPPAPFNIGPCEEVLNGPPSTYDLEWAVAVREVPPGSVRFTVSEPYIKKLTANHPDHGIPLILNAEARKLSLLLRTDRGSKQLTIDKLHVVPFSYPFCKEITEARVCKACSLTVCWECYLKKRLPASHSKHHRGFAVALDKEE